MCSHAHACLAAQSCLTLSYCIDCNPPGSSVHGILQARILEWVAMPSSKGSIFPTQGSNLGLLHCTQILYHLSQQGSPLVFPHITCLFRVVLVSEVKVTQSCPTLCDPVNCSPPGCSVQGILQARILEWVAMPSSRGSSQPRDRSWVSGIAGRRFTL